MGDTVWHQVQLWTVSIPSDGERKGKAASLNRLGIAARHAKQTAIAVHIHGNHYCLLVKQPFSNGSTIPQREDFLFDSIVTEAEVRRFIENEVKLVKLLPPARSVSKDDADRVD